MQDKKSVTGVFLIHGFLGSPREWEDLARQLQGAGYLTHAVTQPGHGKNPQYKLSDIEASEIFEHCKREYQAFCVQCDETVVIGHSLGGVSALWLSGQRVEKLKGTLAFSAPYEFAYGVNYAHGLLKYEKQYLAKAMRYMPDCLTGYERPVISPLLFPRLRRQTAQLLKHLDETLPQIESPVWLAHSPYDLAVPYEEMGKIANRIGKAHLVQTHTLEDCGHQVFGQKRRCKAPYELVFRFLSE